MEGLWREGEEEALKEVHHGAVRAAKSSSNEGGGMAVVATAISGLLAGRYSYRFSKKLRSSLVSVLPWLSDVGLAAGVV